VQVKDKRRVKPDEETQQAGGPAAADASAAEAEVVEPEVVLEPEVLEPEVLEPEVADDQPDYLGDLQRLQADFSNYRKRMMRESAEAASRGAERIVTTLLPVLDNFERAIAHGEGGEGVELVFKELRAVLETAGLEEVPGEGARFDPQVHEAVDSREDAAATEEVVRAVHRRGYTMNDKLLRAAMVGVARPPAPAEEIDDQE
jgi:molecular chaperone GrpE